MIDGASSHTKCDDKAPTAGGWQASHAHLKKMQVEEREYAHLKPLKAGGGYLNETTGKYERKAGTTRHVYGTELAELVKKHTPKPVRNIIKLSKEVGQQVIYLPPYSPELAPIEKMWLHGKDPISRDPEKRDTMTIMKHNLRTAFDETPPKVWRSAYRKAWEWLQLYMQQQEEELIALELVDLCGQRPDLAEAQEADDPTAEAEAMEDADFEMISEWALNTVIIDRFRMILFCNKIKA